MKRKIFVWHHSLPGNLQSFAPLRSCAFLMGAAGPKEDVGIPKGAFWAPQQGMGAAVAWWGSVGTERGWALGGECDRHRLGSRLCPVLTLAGQRVVEQAQVAITAFLPTCKRLKSSRKGQTTSQDVFQCICHRHCSHHQGNQVARI